MGTRTETLNFTRGENNENSENWSSEGAKKTDSRGIGYYKLELSSLIHVHVAERVVSPCNYFRAKFVIH